MPDSIRDLIADLLHQAQWYDGLSADGVDRELADAVLAHPDIRAIIGLAAWADRVNATLNVGGESTLSPEVRALLADWRQP